MNNYDTEMMQVVKENKKGARRAMSSAVLFLIAVTVLSYLVNGAFGMVMAKYSTGIERFVVKLLTFLGADRQSAYTAAKYALNSTAFSYVLSFVTTFVSMVIPALLFSRFVNLDSSESFKLKGRCVKAFFPVFCLCHLFTSLASVFSGVISDFILPGTEQAYEYTGVSAQSFEPFEYIINVLCSAVFVPVVEEYVFRGVLYSYLKRYGVSFGIIASSVIFGVAHLSPTQSVYAFVFGLFSALLFEVTGNLKTSIAFHAINNFITVSLGYVMGSVSMSVFNVISSTYLIIFSGFGIYGVYALCKKDGIFDEFTSCEEQNDGGLCEKPGISQIIVFPLVIYLCYYVYSVVATVM